jgi:hypothetical protein
MVMWWDGEGDRAVVKDQGALTKLWKGLGVQGGREFVNVTITSKQESHRAAIVSMRPEEMHMGGGHGV